MLHDWGRGRLPYFRLPPDDGSVPLALPPEGKALQSLPALAELPDELRACKQDMRELESHVQAARDALERAEAGGDGSDVEDVARDGDAESLSVDGDDDDASRGAGDDVSDAREEEAAEAEEADEGARGAPGRAAKPRKAAAGGGSPRPGGVQWDDVFDDDE